MTLRLDLTDDGREALRYLTESTGMSAAAVVNQALRQALRQALLGAGECLCDGDYLIDDQPFLTHPDCPVHRKVDS